MLVESKTFASRKLTIPTSACCWRLTFLLYPAAQNIHLSFSLSSLGFACILVVYFGIQEEEVRRKAMVVKSKHNGPVIRQHSKIVDGCEKVCLSKLQRFSSLSLCILSDSSYSQRLHHSLLEWIARLVRNNS